MVNYHLHRYVKFLQDIPFKDLKLMILIISNILHDTSRATPPLFAKIAHGGSCGFVRGLVTLKIGKRVEINHLLKHSDVLME